MSCSVRFSTRLSAPADRVWAHATSMAGVNREMAPWMRMTYPPEAEALGLDQARERPGETLFASWVLALGVVPFERWELALVEVGPGMRFVEQSRVLSLSLWRHERTVVPHGSGCVLTDQLTFEPRAPVLRPLVDRIVRAFFAHRHRRLLALFG